MAEEYWFNTATGEVETGRRSSWTDVMGPYPSYAAAKEALGKAHARNESWDQDDEEWEKG